MSVDLAIDDEELAPSTPKQLFQTRMWQVGGPNPPYDVTTDGNRFLVLAPRGVEAITIVLNWQEELAENAP